MAAILHTGEYFRLRFDEENQTFQLDQLDKDGSIECFIDFSVEAFEELQKICSETEVS